MATPNELTVGIAAALGIQVPTVALQDRRLRNAGLRSRSGRGVGSPRMTPGDAANLLIAAAGTVATLSPVTNAAQVLGSFARLHAVATWPKTALRQLRDLPEDHTFPDAIAALIAAAMDRSLELYLARKSSRSRAGHVDVVLIEVIGPEPSASITFGIDEGQITVEYRLPFEVPGPGFDEGDGELLEEQSPVAVYTKYIARLNEMTLFSIANVLKQDGPRR